MAMSVCCSQGEDEHMELIDFLRDIESELIEEDELLEQLIHCLVPPAHTKNTEVPPDLFFYFITLCFVFRFVFLCSLFYFCIPSLYSLFFFNFFVFLLYFCIPISIFVFLFFIFVFTFVFLYSFLYFCILFFIFVFRFVFLYFPFYFCILFSFCSSFSFCAPSFIPLYMLLVYTFIPLWTIISTRWSTVSQECCSLISLRSTKTFRDQVLLSYILKLSFPK